MSSFLNSTITISGPGGCINLELLIIQKALVEFGIEVIIENQHPVENPEEYLSEVKRRYTNDNWGGDAYPSSKKLKSTVKLIVDHKVWGG